MILNKILIIIFSNSHGNDCLSYVSFLFIDPSVNITDIDPVVEGTNVTIQCYVSPSSEVINITWDRNNSTLDIQGNDRYDGGTISSPSLEIYFVQENDDGNYTCKAVNPVGIGKSLPIRLQVLPGKYYLLSNSIYNISIKKKKRKYLTDIFCGEHETGINRNQIFKVTDFIRIKKKITISLQICITIMMYVQKRKLQLFIQIQEIKYTQ